MRKRGESRRRGIPDPFLVGLGLISPLFLLSPAYAYLDLPTGSYILQFLLAAFFAALLMAKVYWQKLKTSIKNLFARNKRGTNDK